VTDDPFAVSSDVGADPRWPRYAVAAQALGIRAQAGLRLFQRGKAHGGLNLYALRSGAFDDHRQLVEMFKSQASLALGFASELTDLQRAMETRTTIGQALGIVMERYGLNEQRAFAFLVRMSQTTNTKLRDIAASVVANQETPRSSS